MSRKVANNSPFALGQVRHGEFLQQPINGIHLTVLLHKLETAKIRTYGELKDFIKKCEKEFENL